MLSLHFAPVQGHTDAAYRHFHANIYGSSSIYYSPFIRIERDMVRPRDVRDITSELNNDLHLVPQIIFRDSYELNKLVKDIKDLGFKEIDLNMGCPFPLQTGHGRGSATIANESLAKEIVECINQNQDIDFSVKMRLGLQNADEWQKLLPYLNKINLKHITLHPRIAKQQYGGEVNLTQFDLFLKNSKNPVVYNGDIKNPSDVFRIYEKFPQIAGIMSARGNLGRPSLFAEVETGKEWDKTTRVLKMLEFHKNLYNHYSSILCGDSQILSKIKPFWEYSEEEIGRKPWKAIKKATNLAKYQSAIAMILN